VPQGVVLGVVGHGMFGLVVDVGDPYESSRPFRGLGSMYSNGTRVGCGRVPPNKSVRGIDGRASSGTD
jgi:hypothetical protein